MRSRRNQRGFVVVEEEKYQGTRGEYTRMIAESSAIGDYENSMEIPGSSYLWIGEDHLLKREQVRELIERMQHWLKHGRLAVDGEGDDSLTHSG